MADMAVLHVLGGTYMLDSLTTAAIRPSFQFRMCSFSFLDILIVQSYTVTSRTNRNLVLEVINGG